MSLAVAIFLLSPCKTRVLLIKRRDVPVYALPGGGVDPGESPEQAAIREMKEETDLDVSIKRTIGYYYPLNRLTYPTILFECEKINGKESPSSETAAVEYFPLDALPYYLPPPYPDWIQDGVGQPTFLFKPIQNVTYLKLIRYLFSHPILVVRFLLARMKIPINSK